MDDRLSCTEVIPCEKLFLEDSENIVPEEFFFQNDNNVKDGSTLVEIEEAKDDVLFGDAAEEEDEINPMNASNISNENPMNPSNISLGTAALENAMAEVFHHQCSSNDEAYNNNKDSIDVAEEQILDSFAPINFDNLGPFYSPYDEPVATATVAMSSNTSLQARATQKRLSAPVPGSYFPTDGGHCNVADNNSNKNELTDDEITDDDDDAGHGNGDFFINATPKIKLFGVPEEDWLYGILNESKNNILEDFKELIPEQNESIPEQNDDVFLETAFYTDSARKVFEQSNLTINELREMEKNKDVDVERTGGRGKFKGTKFIIKNINKAKKVKKAKIRSKEAKMWKEGDAKLQGYFSEESKKICCDTFNKYHDDHDRIAKIALALGGKRDRRKF